MLIDLLCQSFFKKSGLLDWIGEFLQKILPSQKEIALLIIIIACLIGTEVNYLKLLLETI